ncbi:hypothetical protein RHSIM_Rhsim05G0068800 [Rhododendron simsii]|uniref:Protein DETOXIFICATION n=1 Tax=Rhododendron simsii TaxID=118357 RepID=A0A834H746_RHOSS|nr:hypothetical protein RHSIM_Rhsim05G0068800 [Rhododendron simsii]
MRAGCREHIPRTVDQKTAQSANLPIIRSEEQPDIVSENIEKIESFSRREEFVADQSIWNQIGEIVKFSGPATGLWICGPLMSLIDTAVIGQGSSLELAALGPGTVLCDNMSYVFMFLSIATSNMVATSLARRDKEEVQYQISILLFVGLTCGVFMFLFMRFLGFAGVKNAHIVPAANKYVQIRAFAWPAVLVGWVAQSASLGMKDSWGPLKALVVASTVNIIGHIILCSYLGYGIAGAAWATMGSQVISAYMMIEALNNKGYNAFSIYAPSPSELKQIIIIAAPVFLTISSKVAFYSLIIYFATSMGTVTVAAHQAGRDLKFISLTMTGCFCLGSLLLLARFSLALRRLLSPDGILYSEDLTRFSLGKLEAI